MVRIRGRTVAIVVVGRLILRLVVAVVGPLRRLHLVPGLLRLLLVAIVAGAGHDCVSARFALDWRREGIAVQGAARLAIGTRPAPALAKLLEVEP